VARGVPDVAERMVNGRTIQRDHLVSVNEAVTGRTWRAWPPDPPGIQAPIHYEGDHENCAYTDSTALLSPIPATKSWRSSVTGRSRDRLIPRWTLGRRSSLHHVLSTHTPMATVPGGLADYHES